MTTSSAAPSSAPSRPEKASTQRRDQAARAGRQRGEPASAPRLGGVDDRFSLSTGLPANALPFCLAISGT